MKPRHALAVMALTTLLASAPLAGQGSRDDNPGMPTANEKTSRSVETDTALIRYEVSVSAEGTRSEGLSGRLYAGTVLIPGEYHTVEAFGVRYRFTPHTTPWAWWGHLPETSDFTPVVGTDTMTEDETVKGWYTTRQNARKANTPRAWIYLESDSGCFWIDPRKLNDFLCRSRD